MPTAKMNTYLIYNFAFGIQLNVSVLCSISMNYVKYAAEIDL